jgi:hypothetical protein
VRQYARQWRLNAIAPKEIIVETPLNLDQEALGSYNYLEKLVETASGYTFFNVFLTDPAEAVHDWPDFLDVPSRSAEACVLLRHMTGRGVATEEAYFSRILPLQESDGLFHRPETRTTRHEAVREEQALVMGALLAKAIADRDPDAESRLQKLVRALSAQPPGEGPFPAFLIRPVVRAWEVLGVEGARALATGLGEHFTRVRPLFRADGSFAGHVHGHLYAAAGLTELARLTEDERLLDHMERVFRVMRDRSTAFGWVPELAEREDDVVGCETCCLMDYIHLALALAGTGRTWCYDEVERAVRNHLLESRVRHGDWLPAGHGAGDDLVRTEGVQEAVVGAYAGWSSPNHILAYDEFLPPAWIRDPSLAPVYLGKVRALQNCCGPSGPKALYLAWQRACEVEGGTLRVNLLLDRALPEAEVRGFEPWEGRVEVTLAASLRVAVRVPGPIQGSDVTASVAGEAVELRLAGGYVATPTLPVGTTVVFQYPLLERVEEITIGNGGFQQYRYEVTWRGSTVLQVAPGGNSSTGRSHPMEGPVPLYYGTEGPHPLYRRTPLPPPAGERHPLHRTAGPGVW